VIGPFVTGIDHPAIDNYLIPLIEGTWREALEVRPGFQYPQDAYELTPVDADPDAFNWARTNWTRDPVPAPELMAAITKGAISTRLGTWIGALRTFDVYDISQRLEALTVRTLVIWGTQDENFPEPDQVRVRAALDSAIDACNLDYYLYEGAAQILEKRKAETCP
jgi:non-heme chloroperoxidase